MIKLNVFIPGTILMAIVLTGCVADAERTPSGSSEPGLVRIDAEGNDAEHLLRFYFGSFLGPDGGDPVEAGILEKRENSWYLRAPSATTSDSLGTLVALNALVRGRESVSEDEIEAFVQAHYYAARDFPESLSEWIGEAGLWSEPDWFRLEVQGSMVPHRRITWVRRAAIEAALDRMQTLDDPILYDPGTVFVGEHVEGGNVIETTLMRKRLDGFWDYWAYDAEGRLTELIPKEPRDMLIPTRCTGCHYGDRLFEPERSYPGMARPGPSGERTLFIPESWRRSDLASSMQEHARRSDTVLGLYATMYLAEAAAGEAPDPESATRYLDRFGIESSP